MCESSRAVRSRPCSVSHAVSYTCFTNDWDNNDLDLRPQRICKKWSNSSAFNHKTLSARHNDPGQNYYYTFIIVEWTYVYDEWI